MRNKSRVGLVDRTVIVMIVFNSFCDATVAGVWTRFGAAPLLITALLTGALLAVILTMTSFVATRLKFDVEDEIAAVFCGSQQRLAAGAPMAALIRSEASRVGKESDSTWRSRWWTYNKQKKTTKKNKK